MAAAELATQALAKPLADLYELGKDKFQTQLMKWKTAKNIGQLYRKIEVVQKVKTIWQTDKEVKLMTFYYPTRVVIDDQPKQVTAIKQFPPSNCIVQGTVGQGKSIFLRYLCIRELVQGQRIPVFIELRQCDEGGLIQLLMRQLSTLGFDAINQSLFDFVASSGKMVLLLDGFDELSDVSIGKVHSELDFLCQKFPEMQIVITSRPDSGIERSAHFRVYKLARLDRDDHKPFLQKIVADNEQRDNLLAAIQASPGDIKGLLATPLMLTLLVLVYKSEQTIPNQLAEFYETLFTTLLTRHDKSKPGFTRKRATALSNRKLQDLFEAFCFATRQARLSHISEEQLNDCFEKACRYTDAGCDADAFIADITKVACLMEEENMRFHFVHKSVQEFYAASFIRRCPDPVAQKFYAEVIAARRWQQWRQELIFLSQIDRYRFVSLFETVELDQLLQCLPDESLIGAEMDRKLLEFLDTYTVQLEVEGGSMRMSYLRFPNRLLPRYATDSFTMSWMSSVFDGVRDALERPGVSMQVSDLEIEHKTDTQTTYLINCGEIARRLGIAEEILSSVGGAVKTLREYRNKLRTYIAKEQSKAALFIST